MTSMFPTLDVKAGMSFCWGHSFSFPPSTAFPNRVIVPTTLCISKTIQYRSSHPLGVY